MNWKIVFMAGLLAAGAVAEVKEPYAADDPRRAPEVQVGPDNNVKSNPFVQPQEPQLAGNDRDQTLRNGDVMSGDSGRDVLIGGLGSDVLDGGAGNDVIVGGTEHGGPNAGDFAFGGRGSDAFLWAPGDGSDFFDGGPGQDVVIFGLIGEVVDGEVRFGGGGSPDKAGEIWINPETGVPQADVTNQGGFCRIIDRSSSENAKDELDKLALEHLVQFFARGPANSFERGEQQTDNGLRVTLHLRNVETLVCTSRDGGAIEAFDLTVSPPAPINPWGLPHRIQQLIK